MHQLFHGDCLDIMSEIPANSVDLILADLPYGTTQNDFDAPLPLEDYIMVGGKVLSQEQFLLHEYRNGVPYKTALAKFRDAMQPGIWTHYKRIIKDNGCIALFAQPPFDVKLAKSNENWYRYEWIIKKTRPTGHLNARRAPMKAHEKVLIFYKKPPIYNPQMTEGHALSHSGTKAAKGKTNYKQTAKCDNRISTDRFPTDVLTFKWDTRTDPTHPNQKPVDACKYFILTYTLPGQTVLDNCMGSGSAGVACIQTDRNFIGIEKKETIFIDAALRIEEEHKLQKEGVLPYVDGDQTVIQTTIDGF